MASEGAKWSNAAINVMPEGGGRPRDEVGTLNVLAHPTWGILANFEHKCCPGIGKFEQCKMKANRVLICGELGYECSAILKEPIKWKNERNLTNHCFFFQYLCI